MYLSIQTIMVDDYSIKSMNELRAVRDVANDRPTTGWHSTDGWTRGKRKTFMTPSTAYMHHIWHLLLVVVCSCLINFMSRMENMSKKRLINRQGFHVKLHVPPWNCIVGCVSSKEIGKSRLLLATVIIQFSF